MMIALIKELYTFSMCQFYTLYNVYLHVIKVVKSNCVCPADKNSPNKKNSKLDYRAIIHHSPVM